MITDEQILEIAGDTHKKYGAVEFAREIIALAMQVNLVKVESLLRNTEGMSTHAIKEQHVQFNAGVNAALAILRGSDGTNN